jgi:hypothetical protein
MGTFGGGKKKPFVYSQDQMKQLGLTEQKDEADRKVPQQLLKIGTSGERGRGRA